MVLLEIMMDTTGLEVELMMLSMSVVIDYLAEIEAALIEDKVSEAAVVGIHDDITGQAVIAYVALKGNSDEDSEGLRNWFYKLEKLLVHLLHQNLL